MELGSEIHASVLFAVGLDHWPMELWWSSLGSQFKKPFRFEQFWLGHPYFKEKVKPWWEDLSEKEGQIMYKFQQKSKSLKERINKWNKEEFRNIFAKKKLLKTRMKEIQNIGMNSGYTTELQVEEAILCNKLEEREEQEEIL